MAGVAATNFVKVRRDRTIVSSCESGVSTSRLCYRAARSAFSSCPPEINLATWKNDVSFYSTERTGTMLISWSRQLNVEAYRNALLERTRERVPLDWAGTPTIAGKIASAQTFGIEEILTAPQ